MITVYLHIALPGISPLKRQVKMRVSEGTTVKDALTLYTQKCRAPCAVESTPGISILVNGSRGSIKQELKDHDQLKVFRPMVRG